MAEAHGKTRDQEKAALSAAMGAKQAQMLDRLLDQTFQPRAPRAAVTLTPAS